MAYIIRTIAIKNRTKSGIPLLNLLILINYNILNFPSNKQSLLYTHEGYV